MRFKEEAEHVVLGLAGDTLWDLERLKCTTKRFTHAGVDIRDRALIEDLFRTQRFGLIVHCAARPSHDGRDSSRRMSDRSIALGVSKFKKDYPSWKITRGLDTILEQIIASQRQQLKYEAIHALWICAAYLTLWKKTHEQDGFVLVIPVFP